MSCKTIQESLCANLTVAMSSNPIFIDVDASTPAPVKQEQEDIPDGGQKRHKCGMCDYSTCHTTLFKEHSNRHKGVKPYKCSLCPYHSASKQYIKIHEQRHRRGARGEPPGDGQGEGKGGSCGTCGKGSSKRWLDAHVASRYSCPHCQFTTCSGLMQRHLATAHGDRQLPTAPLSVRKDKFVCARCAFSCSSDHKILLHLIHHPQPAPGVDVTALLRCGVLPAPDDTVGA